jgi:hypothetical protein
MNCAKCGYKLGVGIKVTPIAEAKAKSVPHIEAVKTNYVIKCSVCDTQWCCLECAVEYDAISHDDFDRIAENDNYDEPFVVECCNCTGKTRSWEDRE